MRSESRPVIRCRGRRSWTRQKAPGCGPRLRGIRFTVLNMDECPHGLGDPQTCTLCKTGPGKPKITRSPSTITKHRRFTCIVCGVEKPEYKFPTKNPPAPAPAYRNGDEPCRDCRITVRADKKAGGGTYMEAALRVQKIARVRLGSQTASLLHTYIRNQWGSSSLVRQSLGPGT
jgi:hypothetical protein